MITLIFIEIEMAPHVNFHRNSELNETPDFARRLLEWFNYPAPTNTKVVLNLVLQSLEICGDTFVSLGAIEFFRRMFKSFIN